MIDLRVDNSGWDALGLEALAQVAGDATLTRLGIEGPAEIAVLATSDEDVAALNGEFRAKPTPTNVLSWPAQPLAPTSPGAAPPDPVPDAFGELALGDIALAYETCVREAADGNKPLADHATHLLVHAILHLLGYDHISDADARLMEGLEVEILTAVGVPNPYVDGPSHPALESGVNWGRPHTE
ncbi:MAG: rRNA maturation RNase YbeY [Pseudomonadota bacterium]